MYKEAEANEGKDKVVMCVCGEQVLVAGSGGQIKGKT